MFDLMVVITRNLKTPNVLKQSQRTIQELYFQELFSDGYGDGLGATLRAEFAADGVNVLVHRVCGNSSDYTGANVAPTNYD